MPRKPSKRQKSPERPTRVASTRFRPTPIVIARWTSVSLAITGVILSVLFMRGAPSVLAISLGGATLALLLSFPVNALMRFMPRGFALFVTMSVLLGGLVLAFIVIVPQIIAQLSALITAIPDFATRGDTLLRSLFQKLAQTNVISQDPAAMMTNFWEALGSRLQLFAQTLLTSLIGGVSGTVNLAIQIFGIVFVAVYLLLDIRLIKAIYLQIAPHRYRRDAWSLWNAFGQTLSHYLGGQIVIMALQGLLSGVALALLGVPYALLLGLWVSLTAIIPYLGAWLGAVPAIIVAFFVSPTTAVITALLFLAIQQLEGNILTPHIQGQAIRVHPILVFLAVTAGGEFAGLVGVIFAVPLLAIVRVLFDFLRVRLKVQDTSALALRTPTPTHHTSKVYDAIGNIAPERIARPQSYEEAAHRTSV